jgi:hypothetical protein
MMVILERVETSSFFFSNRIQWPGNDDSDGFSRWSTAMSPLPPGVYEYTDGGRMDVAVLRRRCRDNEETWVSMD